MTAKRFSWPAGQAGAVSLTYDDGLPEHHQSVAAMLEANGLRGTFNVNILSSSKALAEMDTDMMTDPAPWRAMAARGHELGNHTLFHPCRSEPGAEMDWMEACFNLCDYTPRRWLNEMRVANFVLRLIDGKTRRTFANTCCNISIGSGNEETSLDPLIEKLFVAARGAYNNRVVDPRKVNFNNLGHFGADGKTFEQLRAEIESAVAAGGWIVYMFHGVGDASHRLHIQEDEHQKLVEWLGAERSRIWTAPMLDVAGHLRAFHGK